jgi:hypothetical protein
MDVYGIRWLKQASRLVCCLLALVQGLAFFVQLDPKLGDATEEAKGIIGHPPRWPPSSCPAAAPAERPLAPSLPCAVLFCKQGLHDRDYWRAPCSQAPLQRPTAAT